MREERKETLQKLCLVFRNKLIDLLYSVQTGHPGGSLSCTEILTALYYELMDVDPMNPEKEDRDHLILSKGHGAPMLYLVLAHKGFFPLAELKNLRQTGSMLQGHPCVHKTPGVELSTGPLGLGLSAGLGMALGARLKGGMRGTDRSHRDGGGTQHIRRPGQRGGGGAGRALSGSHGTDGRSGFCGVRRLRTADGKVRIWTGIHCAKM